METWYHSVTEITEEKDVVNPKDSGILERKAEKQFVFRKFSAGKCTNLKLNPIWVNFE